jgi:hypothetical protein
MFIILLALGIFLAAGLWQASKIGSRPKDFPPGPPTLPIIGNLHQIPSEKRHVQFEKWAREYGPVFSLMLGTKVMIVLNSDVAIKDLVDKRGAIYSSRPEAYIAQNILSGGLRVLFMVWKFLERARLEHADQAHVCSQTPPPVCGRWFESSST